ncbi:hypothetical protein MTO96_006883 [Rhipicephalus appendiculatus]
MWNGGAVNRDRRSALCPGHGQPSLVRTSCPGQLRGQPAQPHPDQYLTVEDRHLSLCWLAPYHPGAQATQASAAKIRAAQVHNTLPEAERRDVDTHGV